MSTSNSIVPTLVAATAGVAAGFCLARALHPRVKPSTVRHVFLGKFKEGVTEAELSSLVEGYQALPKTISSMKGFEWGTNLSKEGLDKGFTHVFVTTFEDQEGVNHYLKHDEHIKFAQEILRQVADVIVVDYNPKMVK